MTAPGRGERPEEVISQAMRAMAGGRREPGHADTTHERALRRRFTFTQVLLIAAIIGVVLGMAGGFAVLLLR